MYDRTAALGRWAERPQRNKIVILGYTSHMHKCPWWHDPTAEIWGINDLYHELGAVFNRTNGNEYDRIRWFQLHSWVELRDDRPVEDGEILNPNQGPPHPRDPNHLHVLKELSQHMPVFLQEHRDELPDCLPFPKDQVYEYFTDAKGRPVKYFTNTITWEIALAIMELKPDPHGAPLEGATLGVYGVDMMQAGPTQDAEYSYQRPSCEWLLGWAMGAGIEVLIPDESDLLKSIYQYGDTDEYYARKRINAYLRDVEAQGNQAMQQKQAAHDHLCRMEGAKGALEWILRSHMPGDDGHRVGSIPVPGSNKQAA